VALTTHPNIAPRLKKELSYTSVPRQSLRGSYMGELYLYLLVTRIRLVGSATFPALMAVVAERVAEVSNRQTRDRQTVRHDVSRHVPAFSVIEQACGAATRDEPCRTIT